MVAQKRLKLGVGFAMNDGSGSRGGRSFLAPFPGQFKTVPGVSIAGFPGQTGVNLLTGVPYIFTGINGWVPLSVPGSAGVFSSLTVTPGPISLTGTTNINTVGAATTNIGTGATGEVNIGNATGTTVITGALGVAGNVTLTSGQIFILDGDITLETAGNKLVIATGANASIGTSTLVAGTVTVATTAVTAASKIFVTHNTPGGTIGTTSVPTASIVDGTSFVINSSNVADTSTVNWWIVN